MKTIIRLFAAVLTAVPVLVSCYSEPLPEVIPEVIPEDEGNGSEQDATTRIITLSFDAKATRTEFSEPGNYNSRPRFCYKDEIMVAKKDGSVTAKRCTVDVANGVATLKTDLQGDLIAVYPADCAMFGGPDSDDEDADWDRGDDKEITGVFAPPVQTGDFKDANICMADIAADATEATFYNKTAVFVLDVPEGTTQLVVTALRKINETTGQRYTAEDEDNEELEFSVRATISREWDNGGSTIDESTGNTTDTWGPWYYSSSEITVGDGTYEIPNPCFVSVMVEDDDAVLLRDLNFDAILSYAYESDIAAVGSMGGFSPRFLKEVKHLEPEKTKAQEGAIYAVNPEEYTLFHDYVVTPRRSVYNLADIRWAKEDLCTSNGYYFMWGELNGHSYVPAEGDNPAYWTGFDNKNGFTGANRPAYISTTYSTKKVLRLEHDAAYYNWGGAWRMATINEWELASGFKGPETLEPWLTRSGYYSGTKSTPETNSSYSYYWSSSMYNAFYINCFCFYIDTTEQTIEKMSSTNRLSYLSTSNGFGMRIKPAAPID